MDLKNYVFIRDNLIPINIVSSLIKFSNSLDFTPAYVGGGEKEIRVVDQSIRNTYAYPLTSPNSSLTHCHRHNLLHYYFSTVIREYLEKVNIQDPNPKFLKIKTIDVLKYKEGGFYKYHVDHFDKEPRTFSCILLLNNDYEGGELCFRYPDTTKEWAVEKKAGRIVVWPSNFLYPHCVKPVTKGVRYSIVSWAI